MHSRYIALRTALVMSSTVCRGAACTASPDAQAAHVAVGISCAEDNHLGRSESREAAATKCWEEEQALARKSLLDCTGLQLRLIPGPENPVLDSVAAHSAQSKIAADQGDKAVCLLEDVTCSEVREWLIQVIVVGKVGGVVLKYCLLSRLPQVGFVEGRSSSERNGYAHMPILRIIMIMMKHTQITSSAF
jgi:hypothetical protein